jgi:hypothetical protein
MIAIGQRISQKVAHGVMGGSMLADTGVRHRSPPLHARACRFERW